MNDRINQVKADLRFWWWKVRHVHAQRYISITTIVAVLVGLTFFSFNNVQKQVFAADGSWAGNSINIVGSEASYMLINNGTVDGTCLWPMNRWSADNFKYTFANNTVVSPYRGKACTTTPTDLEITVNDSATLTLVGDVSVKSMLVQNNAKVTSAPTDSRGNAVPYASRSDYFVSRYTGFLYFDMQVQTAGATKRAFLLRASGYDDATAVDIGSVASDSGPAIDAVTWSQSVYGNGLANGNCEKLHSSFRTTTDTCGGDRTLLNGGEKTLYVGTTYAGNAQYMPIRISAADVDTDHIASLWIRVVDQNATGGTVKIIYDGYLPVAWLFAPQESGVNVGKVDIAGSGYSRFEYAQETTGQRAAVINHTLDKTYLWNGSGYGLAQPPDYHFFSRVNLMDNGTFSGFMQARGAATQKFVFNYGVPGGGALDTAGNPFSNTVRGDGSGYSFGLFIEGAVEYQPHYLQNYKLQNHSDAVSTGIKSGIRLATSGNVNIASGGSVDVSGKGLPGGVNYLLNGVSVPGIGGKAKDTLFGYYPILHNDWTEFGSNWAEGNGGGGGHSGHASPQHSGGGGGGVIGYGGGSYTASIADVRVGNNSVGNMGRPGLGGGGYLGYGGGIDSGGDAPGIAGPGDQTATLNGTSYRGAYNGAAFDAVAMAMGGGGATSSAYPIEIGGSGGGSVKLTVGGNLTMNSSTISASGVSGSSGAGAGGGGSINVKVTGVFDLSSNSNLYAVGGSSFGQKWTDGTDCPSTSLDCYAVPGNGGGGLVRVSASSYTSTLVNVGDSSAWPKGVDFCKPSGFMNSSNNLKISAGGSGGEPGIIDLGATYCSGGESSGSNLQISKQVQQYNTGSPSNRDSITSDGNWYNGLTLTTGKYIRVKIYVTNLSSSAMTGVSVTDTLPIDGMTLFKYNGDKNIVVVSGGNNTELAINDVNTSTISISPLTVPANGTIVVEYATQVK
jgi:uncharacterized repeat protein (TIGR01451 family)